MPTLSAFIVEDNPTILSNLVATLEELTDVRIVGSAPSEEAAVRGLHEHATDLDLVIAFDRGQERILREWAPEDQRSKVQLLTAFDPEAHDVIDVPDPYYSDAALFDSVLVTIERASTALFRQLEPAIRQGVT